MANYMHHHLVTLDLPSFSTRPVCLLAVQTAPAADLQENGEISYRQTYETAEKHPNEW